MSEGRTYSSYHLDDFQTCPRLWDLKKRWSENNDGGHGVYLVLGGAVAAGLSILRRGQSLEEAEQAATKVLEQRADEVGSEWTQEGLLKHILAAVRIGGETSLGLKTILSADQKKYGHCRPDVVGRTHDGKLRIVDDKVKLKLDPKYIDETLSEFCRSNQLYEYAWEVGRFYNEQVTSVGINLIICTPRLRALFYPINLKPDVLAKWAVSAQQDFDEMAAIEAGEVLPRLRWKSCTTRFNKPGTTEKALCVFHTACHELAGDESKMDALYERR